MRTVGIICEYNPFHFGHMHQFEKIREEYGDDAVIVCLMSGNYVQRGMPAIFDKSIRATAAVMCGADLVLELPIGIALSSAEGFAHGGVQILSQCCDVISFGTESLDASALFTIAEVLRSSQFSSELKEALATGRSFPAARSAALQKMGISADLQNPNDILGVEYCKAILDLSSTMDIFPIRREGAYHSQVLDHHSPSATSIRYAMESGVHWEKAVPDAAAKLFAKAPMHMFKVGERAVVARLRMMHEEEFESIPFGSEGLWRKLMKACGKESNLDDIVNSVKSKRYTRTRIDRMILCAFLGLTKEDIGLVPEKIRTLAFNDRGRTVLRNHSNFQNAGETVDEKERMIGSLYGLFCTNGMERPDVEEHRRVYYRREEE